MRKLILPAIAGLALAFISGQPSLLGANDDRHGGSGGNSGNNSGASNTGSGGGSHAPAQAAGGGSFSRPEPQPEFRRGGGEGSGGRLPSNTFTEPHPPTSNRTWHSDPVAPGTAPRTSVPTFETPERHGGGGANFVHPPTGNTPTVIEPFHVTPGKAPEGFIRFPGNNGPTTGPTVPHYTPGMSPGFPTNPKGPHSPGTTAVTGAGLGTMPAIQQHLQQRGQNLQTWSASRTEAFNHWHEQNAPRIEQFEHNRQAQWTQIRETRPNVVRLAHERGAAFETYRQDLWHYRYNRAEEIRDRVRDGCDDLFTYDWWIRHHDIRFPLGHHSPWWWWNPCPWNRVIVFGGYGWTAPVYYDYGANVIVDGDVAIDGQDYGPSSDYAQQAIQLANPPEAPDQPTPPTEQESQDEWQPFGVFALTQEEKGDAVMFFQLAMNRQGLISGAFTNLLTGDSDAVTGSIDRNTQRAAWHVGDKTNTVYEAGVANLTLDVTPVLVHFDTQATQTWLLVRLPSPDLPTAPVPVNTPPQQ